MQVVIDLERMKSVREYMNELKAVEMTAQTNVKEAAIAYGQGKNSYDQLAECEQDLELIQAELQAARTVLGRLGLYSGE